MKGIKPYMMQTLTKTELAWIYKAIEKEVIRNIGIMNECAYGSLEYEIAELRRDNARSVMHKIHNVLNDGSKQIRIK